MVCGVWCVSDCQAVTREILMRIMGILLLWPNFFLIFLVVPLALAGFMLVSDLFGFSVGTPNQIAGSFSPVGND